MLFKTAVDSRLRVKELQGNSVGVSEDGTRFVAFFVNPSLIGDKQDDKSKPPSRTNTMSKTPPKSNTPLGFANKTLMGDEDNSLF